MRQPSGWLEFTRRAAIAVVVVAALGGCTAMLLGSPDGQQSTAVTADRQLADSVRGAFAAARLADRAAIAVTARDGVVTLSGRVASAATRSEAERLARGVQGVRRVINALQ